MYQRMIVVGLLAILAHAGLAVSANAESEQEAAIKAGAKQLTSPEIADLIVGNTVEAKAGPKTFLFHYGADNVLSGQMVDGDWSDSGYYGITDDDRVCISMTNDKGRLRCLTLLKNAGRIMKFNTAGKMTFELLAFTPGNQL